MVESVVNRYAEGSADTVYSGFSVLSHIRKLTPNEENAIYVPPSLYGRGPNER
jgi:hypothetical protein